MQRTRYHPVLKPQSLDEEEIDTVVQVSRRYYQLKLRHAITGAYLHHIGKTERGRCWECTFQT